MYNLLVVDNAEIMKGGIRKTILDCFDNNISIYQVDDGKTACGYVAENQPDLVLMDIIIPKMGGIEATEEMRSNGYEKPIILMSILDYPVEVLKERGATDFVDKTKIEEELCSVLKKYLVEPSD